MISKKIIRAMAYMDEGLLERYMHTEDRLESGKRPGPKLWVRWAAAAAALLLVVVCIWVPAYRNVTYSAQEIAALFDQGYKDGPVTSAYTSICVSSPEYLNVNPISSEKYLSVYQYNIPNAQLSRNEFQHFLDGKLSKLADALGVNFGSYAIEKEEEALSADARVDKYHLFAGQNAAFSTLSLSVYPSADPTQSIVLDGQLIQIDQTQSDAQILASLSGVTDILFDILGVTFSDSRVDRYFNGYSDHGATYIDVYFYNADDHPLNAWGGLASDFLCISFSNSNNYSSAVTSDSTLTRASILYRQYRTDSGEIYQETARMKRISLKEAESLLYQGYVFGGHSCPLCMAAQEGVDFHNYDYVGIEYVFGVDSTTGTPTEGIPFYAFYKQIGTTGNGNLLYAKTYVPAIKVSGYQEYFEAQKDAHTP